MLYVTGGHLRDITNTSFVAFAFLVFFVWRLANSDTYNSILFQLLGCPWRLAEFPWQIVRLKRDSQYFMRSGADTLMDTEIGGPPFAD